jgi:ribosomal protein L32E
MPKQRTVDPTREEAATALVSFRVSRRQRATLRQRASEAGVTVGEYVRRKVLS